MTVTWAGAALTGRRMALLSVLEGSSQEGLPSPLSHRAKYSVLGRLSRENHATFRAWSVHGPKNTCSAGRLRR